MNESKLPDSTADAKATLADPAAFEAYMRLLEETAKELADFDKPYTARSIRQAAAMITLLRQIEQPEDAALEGKPWFDIEQAVLKKVQAAYEDEDSDYLSDLIFNAVREVADAFGIPKDRRRAKQANGRVEITTEMVSRAAKAAESLAGGTSWFVTMRVALEAALNG